MRLPRYLALLRGVNVGGHNLVAMRDLRRLFSSLGLADVTTYLQSGNVLFSTSGSAPAEEALEQAILQELGVRTRVLLRRGAELAQICTANPFAGSVDVDPAQLYLAFAFFPHLQPTILAIFEGVGFVVGFVGLIADRVSRKKMLFWTMLGTFVVTVIIGLTTGTWQHNMTLFWILLVILAGINSLQYLTEDTIKAEVWPTLQRGTLTAIARFVSIGLLIPAYILTSSMPASTYILFNAAVWFVGLVAATAWLVKGRETGLGLSIQTASGE